MSTVPGYLIALVVLGTVIGGHEEKSESGFTTLVTILIGGFDCDGNPVSDRGSGPAEFAFSPSLQSASVAGAITTSDGRSVDVDVSWEGTGPLDSTGTTTTFPGFTGHFKGKRCDAVANGTVVVDGVTLVDGSTESRRSRTRPHSWLTLRRACGRTWSASTA